MLKFITASAVVNRSKSIPYIWQTCEKLREANVNIIIIRSTNIYSNVKINTNQLVVLNKIKLVINIKRKEDSKKSFKL